MQDVPSWHEYFLNIATAVSSRSKDPNTKHGCILVKDRRIIGTGYNSPPYAMDDSSLYLTREGGYDEKYDVEYNKYDFMLHSEKNALLNKTTLDRDFTAYVTGPTCWHCTMDLYQAGCSVIITPKDGVVAKMLSEKDEKLKQLLCDQTNLLIFEV